MFDAKSLLNQFLGGNPAGRPFGSGASGEQGLGDRGNLGEITKGRLSSLSGSQGLAAGGLLGLLLGSRKGRKMAGSLITYGGAAALGLMAYRAFRNWQDGQRPATAAAADPADI